MNMLTLAILAFVLMFALIILGMNIGMTMFIVGLIGMIAVKGMPAAIGILRQVPSSQASSYTLSVIPLFVLMGNAVFESGISDGLFDTAKKWLSRLPGNLACATVLACAVFGSVCGSTIATTATMGTVAFPKMKEAGYSERLAIGSIAVGGGLGILIPPSTTMIIYGVATENSIGKLFAAGVFPGLLCTAIIILQILIMIKFNPSLAPKGVKCSWLERFKSLKSIVSVVILFVIVLGGMFAGFFTVNEAASIGAFAAILMMIFNRRMSFKSLKSILFSTIQTTGMCFLLMIGAQVFSSFLTMTKMPMVVAGIVADMDVSRYVIFAVIVLIYFVMGCIMDAVPMILLTMPVFYPIMIELGFNTIWFGVIIVLVVNLGNITPPVGLNCYVVAGTVKDVPLSTIFRGALPFVFALIVTLVIICIFPQIALFLPSVLYDAI